MKKVVAVILVAALALGLGFTAQHHEVKNFAGDPPIGD